MTKSLFLFQLIILTAVIFGAIFSRHGLLDLRRFSVQIQSARQRVSMVEEENRKLKLQVNLFDHPSQQITESQIRNFLGWARADELVYLERSGR
jgi:cell division protein FtsB